MNNLIKVVSIIFCTIIFLSCAPSTSHDRTTNYSSELKALGTTCVNNSDCTSSICNSTYDKCGCASDDDCPNSGVCATNGLCINIEPTLNTCTKGYYTNRFKVNASLGSDILDITSLCSFTSDTTSLATPNADASFNCLAVGQTDIKATLPASYGNKTISATVKINNTFTVSPEPATCVVGNTVDVVALYGTTPVTSSSSWAVLGGSGQITASTTKGRFNCSMVGLGQYQVTYSGNTNYGNIHVTPVGGCSNPRLDPNTKTGSIIAGSATNFVCFDPYCGTTSEVSTISSWGPYPSTVALGQWYNGRGGCYKCIAAGTMTVNVTYAGSQTSSGTLTCQ
ncbi:MAG: hypothetical protein WCQ47_05945 [bacterium]